MSARITLLTDTLASVLAELDRLDPSNIVAARAHGIVAGLGAAPAVGRPPKVASVEPDDLDRAIAASYVGGLSMLETADRHNTHSGRVRAALNRTGTPTRPKGPVSRAKTERARDARMLDIVARRERGENMQEIGIVYRITRERVRQLLIRIGRVDLTGQAAMTPEELAAVARYVGGDSLDQAAESIGIATTKMRKLILRANEKVRPANKQRKRHPGTVANAERAAALYKTGKSTQQIAEALGLRAAPSVYRLLAIAGARPSRQSRDHLARASASAAA